MYGLGLTFRILGSVPLIVIGDVGIRVLPSVLDFLDKSF